MITEATIKEAMSIERDACCHTCGWSDGTHGDSCILNQSTSDWEESHLGVRLEYLVRDASAVLDGLLKARNGSGPASAELAEIASLQQHITARLITLRQRVRG